MKETFSIEDYASKTSSPSYFARNYAWLVPFIAGLVIVNAKFLAFNGLSHTFSDSFTYGVLLLSLGVSVVGAFRTDTISARYYLVAVQVLVLTGLSVVLIERVGNML